MSDIDVVQGQNEEQLFRDAVDVPTLEQFENPKLPQPQPQPNQETESPETSRQRVRDEKTGQFAKVEEGEEDEQGRVPSRRLREESEARRRAEQQLSELQTRMAAFEAAQRQQQQQPPPKKLDIFDDPQAYIRQEVTPFLEQIRQENRMMLERASADNARRYYGPELVDNARRALEIGVHNQDPFMVATWQAALQSHDPYGFIAQKYVEQMNAHEIGPDLNAYKQRVLEEAMKNPEYQQKVYQAMRGSANGQINRPAQLASPPSSPFPPSLSEFGTAGTDESIMDASDDALFRAAVTARRRPNMK